MALLVQSHRYQAGRVKQFYIELSGAVFSRYNNLTDYFNLRKNNIALATENALLRGQIMQSYQIYDRKTFYTNDSVYNLQYEYVHAKIVSNSITKRNNHLIINKGSKQGVQVGMAVIASDGVVGIVKTVSFNYSAVLSLLHSDSKISAKIKHDNSSGSIVWDGKISNIAQMIDVPSHAKVEFGDTVVSSSYSLAFPEGIAVGTVESKITKPGDNFHSLNIRLAVDFNTIDHVYVIKNLHKTELQELKEKAENDDE